MFAKKKFNATYGQTGTRIQLAAIVPSPTVAQII